jgi:hypothetical protein
LFLKVGVLKKDDGIVSKKGIKTSAWPSTGFGLKQNHEKWCKFCLAWLGNPFRFWEVPITLDGNLGMGTKHHILIHTTIYHYFQWP